MSARPGPAIDLAHAPTDLAAAIARAKEVTDREMDARLPLPDLPDGDPARRLVEAMRYAALAPGKRLRPALVLLACEATGGEAARAAPACAAIELFHTYTLVHDDLPAMDDDDLRRGRPTVHRAYDEATAILVGDGLLTCAFAALADLGAEAAPAITTLARRGGGWELLAGQALDLASGGGGGAHSEQLTFEQVERLHRGKTGALFSAAAELGAIAARAPDTVRESLAAYGMALGVAFQHADDLDDGDFASHAERAAIRRQKLGEQAIAIASGLGPRGAQLVALARFVGG